MRIPPTLWHHAKGVLRYGVYLSFVKVAVFFGGMPIEKDKARLQKGDDIDGVDSDVYTPLHLAAGMGHAAAVTKLLEAGAYADAADDDGETPLHLAAHVGHAGSLSLSGECAVAALRVFHAFDLDGNGRLDAAELEALVGAVRAAGGAPAGAPRDLAQSIARSIGDDASRVSEAAGIMRGASIAGMPSLGGPPDMISDQSAMLVRSKSVSGHCPCQRAGWACAAPATAPAIAMAAKMAAMFVMMRMSRPPSAQPDRSARPCHPASPQGDAQRAGVCRTGGAGAPNRLDEAQHKTRTRPCPRPSCRAASRTACA